MSLSLLGAGALALPSDSVLAAFPTGCLQLVIGQAGSAGVTYNSGALTTTGFTFYNTAGTGSHRWLAIGH